MSKENETKSTSIPIVGFVIAAIIAVVINSKAFKPQEPSVAPEGFTYLDGRLFANEMQISKSKQLFLGGGTRMYSGASVYAAGVYLNESSVKSLKKKYKSDDATALSENNSFFKEISDSNEKTLLLQIHRTVHTLKVTSMISADIKSKVDESVTKDFSKKVLSMVSAERVFKDFALYINCKGDSVKLSKTFDDLEESEAYQAKGFCNALFESYLGKDSIATPAMSGVAQTFTELN